jgi:DNA gyrase subunit B
MDIPTLTWLEHVRKRPGMYIGSTGPRGLAHLIFEVVSNSLDQVLAGKADTISVTVTEDGWVTVSDNGYGISVLPRADGIPFLEHVFTEFHDSPTADGHTPHVHVSLGVGLAVVCALSETIEVTTSNGVEAHAATFSKGCLIGNGIQPVKSSTPPDRGTTIRLLPDPQLFDYPRIPLAYLEEQFTMLSGLIPGVKLTLAAETHFPPSQDLTTLYNARFRSTTFGPFLVQKTTDVGTVNLAMGFNKYGQKPEGDVLTFCNYSPTVEGGTHVAGLTKGLAKVLRSSGKLPLKHVQAVLHVNLSSPQFSGPAKGKLGSPEAVQLVASAMEEFLPAHLAAIPNFLAELLAD